MVNQQARKLASEAANSSSQECLRTVKSRAEVPSRRYPEANLHARTMWRYRSWPAAKRCSPTWINVRRFVLSMVECRREGLLLVSIFSLINQRLLLELPAPIVSILLFMSNAAEANKVLIRRSRRGQISYTPLSMKDFSSAASQF